MDETPTVLIQKNMNNNNNNNLIDNYEEQHLKRETSVEAICLEYKESVQIALLTIKHRIDYTLKEHFGNLKKLCDKIESHTDQIGRNKNFWKQIDNKKICIDNDLKEFRYLKETILNNSEILLNKIEQIEMYHKKLLSNLVQNYKENENIENDENVEKSYQDDNNNKLTNNNIINNNNNNNVNDDEDAEDDYGIRANYVEKEPDDISVDIKKNIIDEEDMENEDLYNDNKTITNDKDDEDDDKNNEIEKFFNNISNMPAAGDNNDVIVEKVKEIEINLTNFSKNEDDNDHQMNNKNEKKIRQSKIETTGNSCNKKKKIDMEIILSESDDDDNDEDDFDDDDNLTSKSSWSSVHDTPRKTQSNQTNNHQRRQYTIDHNSDEDDDDDDDNEESYNNNKNIKKANKRDVEYILSDVKLPDEPKSIINSNKSRCKLRKNKKGSVRTVGDGINSAGGVGGGGNMSNVGPVNYNNQNQIQEVLLKKNNNPKSMSPNPKSASPKRSVMSSSSFKSTNEAIHIPSIHSATIQKKQYPPDICRRKAFENLHQRLQEQLQASDSLEGFLRAMRRCPDYAISQQQSTVKSTLKSKCNASYTGGNGLHNPTKTLTQQQAELEKKYADSLLFFKKMQNTKKAEKLLRNIGSVSGPTVTSVQNTAPKPAEKVVATPTINGANDNASVINQLSQDQSPSFMYTEERMRRMRENLSRVRLKYYDILDDIQFKDVEPIKSEYPRRDLSAEVEIAQQLQPQQQQQQQSQRKRSNSIKRKNNKKEANDNGNKPFFLSMLEDSDENVLKTLMDFENNDEKEDEGNLHQDPSGIENLNNMGQKPVKIRHFTKTKELKNLMEYLTEPYNFQNDPPPSTRDHQTPQRNMIVMPVQVYYNNYSNKDLKVLNDQLQKMTSLNQKVQYMKTNFLPPPPPIEPLINQQHQQQIIPSPYPFFQENNYVSKQTAKGRNMQQQQQQQQQQPQQQVKSTYPKPTIKRTGIPILDKIFDVPPLTADIDDSNNKNNNPNQTVNVVKEKPPAVRYVSKLVDDKKTKKSKSPKRYDEEEEEDDQKLEVLLFRRKLNKSSESINKRSSSMSKKTKDKTVPKERTKIKFDEEEQQQNKKGGNSPRINDKSKGKGDVIKTLYNKSKNDEKRSKQCMTEIRASGMEVIIKNKSKLSTSSLYENPNIPQEVSNNDLIKKEESFSTTTTTTTSSSIIIDHSTLKTRQQTNDDLENEICELKKEISIVLNLDDTNKTLEKIDERDEDLLLNENDKLIKLSSLSADHHNNNNNDSRELSSSKSKRVRSQTAHTPSSGRKKSPSQSSPHTLINNNNNNNKEKKSNISGIEESDKLLGQVDEVIKKIDDIYTKFYDYRTTTSKTLQIESSSEQNIENNDNNNNNNKVEEIPKHSSKIEEIIGKTLIINAENYGNLLHNIQKSGDNNNNIKNDKNDKPPGGGDNILLNNPPLPPSEKKSSSDLIFKVSSPVFLLSKKDDEINSIPVLIDYKHNMVKSTVVQPQVYYTAKIEYGHNRIPAAEKLQQIQQSQQPKPQQQTQRQEKLQQIKERQEKLKQLTQSPEIIVLPPKSSTTSVDKEVQGIKVTHCDSACDVPDFAKNNPSNKNNNNNNNDNVGQYFVTTTNMNVVVDDNNNNKKLLLSDEWNRMRHEFVLKTFYSIFFSTLMACLSFDYVC